jgi:hypothetical protein
LLHHLLLLSLFFRFGSATISVVLIFVSNFSQEADLTSSGYLGDDEDSNNPDQEEGDGEVTSALNPQEVCHLVPQTLLLMLFDFALIGALHLVGVI